MELSQSISSACPRCTAVGRSVKPITPQSLLNEEAKTRGGALEGLRFCATPTCDVAYYGADGVFVRDELTVRIGVKDGESPRLVCYCTGRTFESIEEELRKEGRSTAVEEITALCKAHKDRCAETNPQGVCCLGNVRSAIKSAEDNIARVVAAPATPIVAGAAAHDCCAVDVATTDPSLAAARVELPATAAPDRRGLLTATGAVIAAVLSSACCWLPLALIGFGASASGVAGVFEQYRAVLLGVTVLLLGGGFYLVYFRAPRCEPGSACELPNPRLQRANKGMLWVATVVVAAFAFFPKYVGVVLGGGEAATVAAEHEPSLVRSYRVAGMTCESCITHVKDAVAAVPGVVAVDVDYAAGMARIHVQNANVADSTLVAAIAGLGYEASRVD